jgi:hypothetical protein
MAQYVKQCSILEDWVRYLNLFLLHYVMLLLLLFLTFKKCNWKAPLCTIQWLLSLLLQNVSVIPTRPTAFIERFGKNALHEM